MSEGTWDDPAVVYGRGSWASYLKGLGLAAGRTAVAPNDEADLAFVARGLYVGGDGDVHVAAANGDLVTFAGVRGARCCQWPCAGSMRRGRRRRTSWR